MVRLRLFLVIFLAAIALSCADDYYHCGMGSVTKALSRIFSFGCDNHRLSQSCCKPHDTCYESAKFFFRGHPSFISQCDEEFNACIWHNCYDASNSICRSWIYFSHGKVTQYFNKFCSFLGNVFC